eukprot:scaffold28718_cov32-Attheya_sp.AAC.1
MNNAPSWDWRRGLYGQGWSMWPCHAMPWVGGWMDGWMDIWDLGLWKLDPSLPNNNMEDHLIKPRLVSGV